ncbi:MAG: Rpp14/Pop5 family protein [Candidatus Hadarchaeales archaeon]
MEVKARRRYIAFQISGSRVERGKVADILSSLLQQISLNLETPEAEPKLILFDEATQQGLLRCGHRLLAQVKDKLSRAEGMNDKGTKFIILGVSGTIKTAKRKFFSSPRGT